MEPKTPARMQASFDMCLAALRADCDSRESTGVKDEQVRHILRAVESTKDPFRKMYYILAALMTSGSIASGVLFDEKDVPDPHVAEFLSQCCNRFDRMIRGLTEAGELCASPDEVCFTDVHEFVYRCMQDAWCL